MNFVDTHAHLYKEYYPNNFHEVVSRSVEAQVTQIILPCVNARSVPHIFDAVTAYPHLLFPLIGLHPIDVNDNYKEELSILETYLSRKEIIGIGEVGIDMYHNPERLNEQIDAFEQQLQWAISHQLPLSVHIRNGYEEAFSVLKNFKNQNLKGVLHCFSGGIQEAKWAINFGFKLGIGGVVTFKNNKLENIVREVGIAHIVLETDAPFLAPHPYRGKENESAYIPLIAEKIATIFDISIDEVKQITTQNAWEVFTKISPYFS